MAGLLPTVELMQPVLTGRPFHREAWVYEEKVDSRRVVAYKDADRVRLVNRNGGDLTRRFPELAAVVGALPARTLILDGEVVIRFSVVPESLYSFRRIAVSRPERDMLVLLHLHLEAERPAARATGWNARHMTVRSPC